MAKKKLAKRKPVASKKALVQTRKYKKNFLSEVIARVDFSPGMELADDEPPAQPAKLRRRFPSSELTVTQTPEIEHSHSNTTLKVVRSVNWQFNGGANIRYYKLTENALLVQYRKYESYERLKSDFMPLIDHFLGKGEDRLINRIGLRYVNSIKINESEPTSWRKYLKAELLSSFGLADDVTTVARAFSTLEFNYDNGSQMRFQYGMPNPDFPAPIKQKLFVMDWDAYSVGIEAQPGEVATVLDVLHDKVNASFEEVITDELRKKMGEK